VPSRKHVTTPSPRLVGVELFAELAFHGRFASVRAEFPATELDLANTPKKRGVLISSTNLRKQSLGIPNLIGDLPVQLLPLVKTGFPEFVVPLERQPGRLAELGEAGV
jgi:hypothetical protein